MVRGWAILFMFRALMSSFSNGNVIVDTAQEPEVVPVNPHEEGGELCKKCLCRVGGGCDGVDGPYQNVVCASYGPMCCCCMPGRFPCHDMAGLLQYPDDDSLGALEEGLEDIGRLER